jgi:hypothetical protein
MRVALWVAGSVVVVILLVVVIGWLLPVRHEASVTRTFAHAPDVLYRLIADRDAYTHWWSDDPRILSEVLQATPPRRFVTRIADPDQPFGGTWTFEIAAEGAGSRVTITERGEIYNPVFRFVSRFVIGYRGTMTSFLNAAAARLDR